MKKKDKTDPPYFYVVEWLFVERGSMSLSDLPRWRYQIITRRYIAQSNRRPSHKVCWKTRQGAEKARVGRREPSQIVLLGKTVTPSPECQETAIERDYIFRMLRELEMFISGLQFKFTQLGEALRDS